MSLHSDATRFRNPIIPGFHPDPSICRAGEDYFLVTSSFEYFPGVPLFHSRDLVHWRQIGHCLTRPSQLPLAGVRPSGGVFAPTIRYQAGTFYMVTTNVSGGGNFYVSTDDPFGAWSEPAWLKQGGIDPSLFFDDDGRVYLSSTTEGDAPVKGIQQAELDLATGRQIGEARLLWAGTGGQYPEAPHMYKIGGSYYLMIAEGGTEYGHMETLARGSSPWGPWESCPHNPILTHRSYHSPIQVVGHADMVEAHDGSWWVVALAVRPNGYPPVYHLGRETYLAPLSWDDEGWPHIGQEGRIALEAEAPRLTPVQWEAAPERDDFDRPQLGPEWNFLGNPEPKTWSLSDRPGSLRLRGNAARLDDGPPVAYVGRRQQHFACEVATALDFEPRAEGEEAGLVVWMNPRHHYEVYVAREAGARVVAVRRRIGSLAAVVASSPLDAGPVGLEIQASRDSYTFAFTAGEGGRQVLATGETRYLSTEVAGGFTGVYVALYASGGGRASSTPAYFDWFDYRPGDE